MKGVEFAAGDDQFALAEFELPGPLPRHPIPLAASLRAELLRPAATGPLGEDTATPTTPGHFRHDEIVGRSRPPPEDRRSDGSVVEEAPQAGPDQSCPEPAPGLREVARPHRRLAALSVGAHLWDEQLLDQ